MTYTLGIDEAGKGPVIGNMFVVGAVMKIDYLEKIKKLGVKDSKLLSKHMREVIYEITKNYIERFYVEEIAPEVIDRQNINEILLKCYVNIAFNAIRDFNEQIAYIVIDLPSFSSSKIKDALKLIGFKGKIVAEHFADKKYVEVSMASIIAKVHREHHVKTLKKIYGDFGSGYPSDPKTIAWIKEFYKKNQFLPSIVRKSWKTIKEIAPREYISKKKRRR